MIKNRKLPKNIKTLIKKAASYLDSLPEVQFACLFGGLAKSDTKLLSDVDIAIYQKQVDNMGERKLEYLGHLMDILKTDEIDLVILNQASLPLRMNILKSNLPLVDKEPFQRHKYESLTMREYFDFSFIEKGILRRRYLNG